MSKWAIRLLACKSPILFLIRINHTHLCLHIRYDFEYDDEGDTRMAETINIICKSQIYSNEPCSMIIAIVADHDAVLED